VCRRFAEAFERIARGELQLCALCALAPHLNRAVNAARRGGALLDRGRPLSRSGGVIELFHDANHQHQDAFFVALAGDDEGLADVGLHLQERQKFLAAGAIDAGGQAHRVGPELF